jgi:uncharacterized protein (TIGR02271 family)
MVLPVVRETLRVGKRKRETAVQVEISPRLRKEKIDMPLMHEEAAIERVPVNRVVEKVEPVRQEGHTTVVPVYEEVVVVERRLVLKEEIRITRRKQTRHERREVELRSEDVRVSRSPRGHANQAVSK